MAYDEFLCEVSSTNISVNLDYFHDVVHMNKNCSPSPVPILCINIILLFSYRTVLPNPDHKPIVSQSHCRCTLLPTHYLRTASKTQPYRRHAYTLYVACVCCGPGVWHVCGTRTPEPVSSPPPPPPTPPPTKRSPLHVTSIWRKQRNIVFHIRSKTNDDDDNVHAARTHQWRPMRLYHISCAIYSH